MPKTDWTEKALGERCLMFWAAGAFLVLSIQVIIFDGSSSTASWNRRYFTWAVKKGS